MHQLCSRRLRTVTTRKHVRIPRERLLTNVGRFVYFAWFKHPVPLRLVDVYEDERGRLQCIGRTSKGREFTADPHQVAYYRGFEDPW